MRVVEVCAARAKGGKRRNERPWNARPKAIFCALKWPFVTCWLSGICGVVAAFVAGVQRVFFRFGGKHLQNSLRIQEIFIKFASSHGTGRFLCSLFIVNYESTKNIPFSQFFFTGSLNK